MAPSTLGRAGGDEMRKMTPLFMIMTGTIHELQAHSFGHVKCTLHVRLTGMLQKLIQKSMGMVTPLFQLFFSLKTG